MKWYLVILFQMLSTAHAFELIGTAKDLKSGAVLYIEKHIITSGEDGLNRLIQTEYRKPDGNLFATMKTDFQEDSYLPKIEFVDERFAVTEIQTYDKAQKTLKLTRSEKNKETIKKEFPVVESMVSGQGFTNFIRINFDTAEGSKVKFNFVVLAKMDFYKFEILVKDDSQSEIKFFQLSPGNFIFRMFAHPIEVGYHRKSKRISSYKGLSNILTDDNKNQEVLISYTEGPP